MAEALNQLKLPTVAELDEHLRSLVDWETFGIQLRGIEYEDIETIMKEKAGNNAGQKLALYHKWLTVCPDATWRDVSTALEKASKFTLEKSINSLPISEQYNEGQRKEIRLTEIKEEEDAVISELKNLHSSYRVLFTRTREHIEELVETNQLLPEKVTSRLKDALSIFSIKELTNCNLITEIFDILREQHSHFLDGSVLEQVIESVIGESDLLQDVIKYIERVQEFKNTQPIETLKDKLKEIKIAKNHIPLTIKLNKSWGNIYIHLVEHLIKTLLQLKGDIQWIRVDPGSVQIIISVPKEEENRIINTCSQKEDFMKQMGIFYLQIGTNTILETQENNHYSFELGLLEACAVGNIETVQFLLHYQFLQHISVDVDHTNNEGQTPLMIASKNGHGNIVKLLLSEKANVNKQDNIGQTAVMLAKTIEIYQTLVQANADTTIVTHKGSTPLYVSCIDGNHEVAEHLLFTLKHDITTRPDGGTILMAASRGGNYRIVQYLLEKEHDPNTQDNDGRTAIQRACLMGHYTVTELLLKHKADLNLPTHNGWTPLMVASQKGHIKIVELLLQNGVDPNVTNTKNGATALILASLNGHHDSVELLLMKGADPNACDCDGFNALMFSCYDSTLNHLLCTQLLLEVGADPFHITPDGSDVLDILQTQSRQTLDLILKHISKTSPGRFQEFCRKGAIASTELDNFPLVEYFYDKMESSTTTSHIAQSFGKEDFESLQTMVDTDYIHKRLHFIENYEEKYEYQKLLSKSKSINENETPITSSKRH